MKSRSKRWLQWLGFVLGLSFLGLNVSAYLHARQMTRFVSEGFVTPAPEKLTKVEKMRVLFTGVRVPKPRNLRKPADYGLSGETVTFEGAHGFGLEAWLLERPENKGVVLLFHGYTGAKDSMLPAAKEFWVLGYNALLVDFYGSGGSAGNETSIGYYEAVDVAAAFAVARQRYPEKPLLLYGASMGAAAILRAIHELGVAPDAVILESPFDRMLSAVENRFAAMRLPSFPAAHLLVFWGGIQQGYNGFGFNPAEYAISVRCPALVMGGDADARATSAQVRNVCDRLAGPHELKTFPGLGHQSFLAARPEEWKVEVGKFLEKLAGSPTR